MKTSRPVGMLGMTDEERAKLRRTMKWPMRQVEAAEGPPGLSLTSLPSLEFLRGYVYALKQPRRRGRPPAGKDLEAVSAVRQCLTQTGGRTEEARKLYVERSTEVKDTASRRFSRVFTIIKTLASGD
jgi:hypothetical protein